MAPPAKPGVTLREADMWLRHAWSRPFVECPEDWDPVTKSHPARTSGTCRHKATWLKQMIGGTVIYGRRTDKPNAPPHAVLWVSISGHEFMLDYDGIWPAKGFPFAREMFPKPPPEPVMRTYPYPVAVPWWEQR